ncbi:prolyl-tRNA synthetase associated domain-containing protein [Altererythrobacter arenosus]|uniref:Prolyl-tRNA synthetase associated domain-containing protein n=1 Tax=Altererythrobacter arenosus TaxID=3032592 RepID=A0ABY8FWL8_9SPHN|nr:prolyl-tRNA synthetase associated domain-containing protein [Altererythrobacter sp. CAU 1644]WFL76429.1 prolyl-tRNA synthetase associated domain-containing protein [Altererythrobacter sp. CAU 1644]
MEGEEKLWSDLDALRIAYENHEHEAVFTVEESRGIKAGIPGEHTKNLFLKDAAGDFLLVTVPSDDPVDLKALPHAIGCKRVSFGKAEDMIRLIRIEPGSVTPLAMINAAPGAITLVLDQALSEADRVNVHPLRNTATVGLPGEHILRLTRHWGHEPVVAAIPKKEA